MYVSILFFILSVIFISLILFVDFIWNWRNVLQILYLLIKLKLIFSRQSQILLTLLAFQNFTQFLIIIVILIFIIKILTYIFIDTVFSFNLLVQNCFLILAFIFKL